MNKNTCCKLVIFSIFLLSSVQILFSQKYQGIKWSKDGNRYFVNENGSILQYQLPAFTASVVIDKKQLVPKQQTTPLDIKNFLLSADEKMVLIYTNSKKVWRYETRGDYWVYNTANGSLQQLGVGKPASLLMFAKFSPDGTKVAYVSGHNLYSEDLSTHAITALTTNGTDKLINGTFDWVYEEEFDCRDGFRWSPDSKSIAFWQIDASNIRFYLMLNTTDSIYSHTVPVEYPKVGEDPSACKIGVVSLATQQTTWLNVPGDNRQHYLPRMDWSGNNELIVQQLNRKQNESKLWLVDATNGIAKNMYTETSTTWIDIESSWTTPTNTAYGLDWRWINGYNSFLWQSEKDGWRHLYLLSKDGKKETLLTNGKYDVQSIGSIDEKNGYVYFTASPTNATQAYLYRVSLTGKGTAQLISPATSGTHEYQISPNGSYAIHMFSNYKTSGISEWVALPKHNIIKPDLNKALVDDKTNVSMIQVTTNDSVTMDGWMIKPSHFDSTKKYPVVFYVYTEPGATTVSDKYGEAGNFLYNGDMSGDGYIQISLDGRGTPASKGAAWRKAIYEKVGILNVHDQAMAAKKILQWPFVDTSRIAVWGWSGGGSTTLNLMFQYPEIYKTGIAIAPVAYRLTYDNIYEERYMGLPQEDKTHYIKASAITYAKGLKGNLLLIHGTGDDNVHYQNTELLINELVKYNKAFQLMVYPNRTHSIREGAGTRLHLSNLYTNYLREHCPGGGR